MAEHFHLVLLDARRKFLSIKKAQTAGEVGAYVARMLSNPIIGSISIKRVQEKSKVDDAHNGHA